MKKQSIPVLVIITVAFFTFTLGFFLGKNYKSEPVTVSIPDSMYTVPPEPTSAPAEALQTEPVVRFPININEAGVEEFSVLPGIGEVLAQRIVDYRNENGAFQSVDDLLNVKGIGKKRFEDIIDLITVGG